MTRPSVTYGIIEHRHCALHWARILRGLIFFFFSDTELTASVLKERFCVFLAAECAVSHRLIHSGLQSVAVQLDSVYKPCQRQETEIETVSDHITPSEEKYGQSTSTLSGCETRALHVSGS